MFLKLQSTLETVCNHFVFPLPHSHNKIAGKELQKQLSQRVLNEDLRAFLELIQRVQVGK